MPGGRGGRPRTPTALKLVRGDTRKSRLPGTDGEGRSLEPQPRDGLPAKPGNLTAGASRWWDHAIVEIGEAGVLKGADAAELRNWAEAQDRAERWGAMLDATGPLITGARSGELVKNPLAGLVDREARRAHELARSIGLNPSGRASLIVGALPGIPPLPGPHAVADDPIADLLNPRRLAARRAATQRRRGA